MDRPRRPGLRSAFAALGVLAALTSGLLDPPPAEAGPAASTSPLQTTQPVRAGPTHARPRAAGGSQDAPATGFGWPLQPKPTVSKPFQPPSRPYGPGHRGVDLAGGPGQPVLAAGDGIVLYARPLADRGVLSIRHPDGLRTTYEPVTATVRPGRLVHRGEPIGTLEPGHAGCPVAACLHWGLLRDRSYLDPIQLVRAGAVRLLPWPPGVN
jgi:murein DD-endopeptidase MepM/ murein hydrolase activator NlpD